MASNDSSRNQSTDAPKKEESPAADTKPDVPTIQQPEPEVNGTKDNSVTTNAPLAPPPKPTQNGNGNGNGDGDGDGDYFNAQPNGTQLSKEPNPFENAFGAPPQPTTKPQLPGVTSLTSPASLLPGNTPGWPGSLRSGPLSPAMLTGPANNNDYFNSDHHFTGSFPTPNESSLRTGLTPGGGGSMFPHPSPNSQALYNSLQSGGATPGTLDFHRTAMTARAQTAANTYNLQHNGATSQPQNPNIQPDLDSKPFNNGATSNPQQQGDQDPFSSHQTNDAANGLFMLAQAGGQRGAQQQQQQQLQQQQAPHAQAQQQYPVQQQGYHQAMQHDRVGKNSIGSTMSGSTDAAEQYSENEGKTSGKGRGKKGSAGKAQNGKRKTDETPSKGQGNKRQRGSVGQAVMPEDEDDDDDDDMMMDDHPDGNRKMTDEEKRKNFLERNRVAALKCRQRKKQWLANLQQKVEIFSTENDALAATVTQLREEIVGLKTLLLAHKDCPVSQAQGISGMAMQQIAGDAAQYANPYGMGGMGHGPPQGQMQQGQMQRS